MAVSKSEWWIYGATRTHRREVGPDGQLAPRALCGAGSPWGRTLWSNRGVVALPACELCEERLRARAEKAGGG